MVTAKAILEIKKLHVSVEGKTVLSGASLTVAPGEIAVVMGPNGAGKSSLAHVIMGNPEYRVLSGTIELDGEDVLQLPIHERSRRGIFLAFQNPHEVDGLPLMDFLFQIHSTHRGDARLSPRKFRELVFEKCELVGLDVSFLERSLNVGASGGEKKKIEMLQLAILEPKLAILDELDSGLDVDALREVCAALKRLKEKNSNMSLMVITHYHRMLKFLEPDRVHVMCDGKIMRSGSCQLSEEIENRGFKVQ
ncbi:Fe-S cluster assembly ATPase SufC [bacterium]|nr:Fe-S cluster assembly ATPase SufC [bacterium]